MPSASQFAHIYLLKHLPLLDAPLSIRTFGYIKESYTHEAQILISHAESVLRVDMSLLSESQGAMRLGALYMFLGELAPAPRWILHASLAIPLNVPATSIGRFDLNIYERTLDQLHRAYYPKRDCRGELPP